MESLLLDKIDQPSDLKKLNEQICDDLQQHFGEKAAFLQQLAQQLLVRKN